VYSERNDVKALITQWESYKHMGGIVFSYYGSLFLEKKKIWKKEKFNALKAANLKLQQIQRILWNFAVEGNAS
jgi:hypothetical protein